MIGRVVSVKMNKTAVVLVENRKTHPLYKKSFRHSKKYLADDSQGVKLGDIVDIKKVKPISKRKHWMILKVVGKDVVALGNETMAKVAQAAIEEVMPEEEETVTLEAKAATKEVVKSEKNTENLVKEPKLTKEAKLEKRLVKVKKGKAS